MFHSKMPIVWGINLVIERTLRRRKDMPFQKVSSVLVFRVWDGTKHSYLCLIDAFENCEVNSYT